MVRTGTGTGTGRWANGRMGEWARMPMPIHQPPARIAFFWVRPAGRTYFSSCHAIPSCYSATILVAANVTAQCVRIVATNATASRPVLSTRVLSTNPSTPNRTGGTGISRIKPNSIRTSAGHTSIPTHAPGRGVHRRRNTSQRYASMTEHATTLATPTPANAAVTTKRRQPT